jgi:hypothetical protein
MRGVQQDALWHLLLVPASLGCLEESRGWVEAADEEPRGKQDGRCNMGVESLKVCGDISPQTAAIEASGV